MPLEEDDTGSSPVCGHFSTLGTDVELLCSALFAFLSGVGAALVLSSIAEARRGKTVEDNAASAILVKWIAVMTLFWTLPSIVLHTSLFVHRPADRCQVITHTVVCRQMS